MKKRISAVCSVILTLALILSVCVIGISAAEANSTIGVTVAFHQTDARQLLGKVNGARDDGAELKYDYALEKCAMQRAAEMSVFLSHTRPDGTDFTSMNSSSVYPAAEGYVVTAANQTADKAFTKLFENDTQRGNMLNSGYKTFAAASAERGSYRYWVVLYGLNASGAAETAPENSSLTVGMTILDKNIASSTYTITTPNVTVGRGNTVDAPYVSANIITTSMYPADQQVSVILVVPWTSASPAVAFVKDGKITGITKGYTQLTVNSGIAKGARMTVNVTDQLTATISAAKTSVKSGEVIKLTAKGSGGSGSYTYKFIVYNETTNQWYKLQDFSGASTYNWNSSAKGKKHLYVDVKDSSGAVARAGVDIDVTSDLKVGLASTQGANISSGTSVTLKATASGGVAPYQYKFVIHNLTTDQWYRLQDYSSKSEIEWYSGVAGKKNIYVDVVDATGTYIRQGFQVNVTELTASGLTSSKGTRLKANTTTTLTANASYGTGKYTYKFIVYNKSTNSWYKLRDFAASNSYDWYTSVAGQKTLYVDIKDSANKVVRKELNVTVV